MKPGGKQRFKLATARLQILSLASFVCVSLALLTQGVSLQLATCSLSFFFSPWQLREKAHFLKRRMTKAPLEQLEETWGDGGVLASCGAISRDNCFAFFLSLSPKKRQNS